MYFIKLHLRKTRIVPGPDTTGLKPKFEVLSREEAPPVWVGVERITHFMPIGKDEHDRIAPYGTRVGFDADYIVVLEEPEEILMLCQSQYLTVTDEGMVPQRSKESVLEGLGVKER